MMRMLILLVVVLQGPGKPGMFGDAFLLPSRHPNRAVGTISSSEPRRAGKPHQDTTTSIPLMLADSTSSAGTVELFANNKDFWVFVAGIFPFAWATVEFWRRIAVGESFGTGRDSVVIGMDDSPADSRGRRVLGKGALATAVVLFALAFATIGIALFSVVTSDAPPDVFPSVTTTNSALEGASVSEQ